MPNQYTTDYPQLIECEYCGVSFRGSATQRLNARRGRRAYCSDDHRNKDFIRNITVRFSQNTVRLPNGCLEWTGCQDRNGYGVMFADGKQRHVHHVAWFRHYGEWPPPGFELDHICHDPKTCRGGIHDPHRLCTEWSHLVLTVRGAGTPEMPGNNSKERCNSFWANKTHCPKGHPYNEENTRYDKKGRRHCLACEILRGRDRQQRRVAERIALSQRQQAQ